MKTAYEAGKEYNERGWNNVILPRIERMLEEMTEHVCDWWPMPIKYGGDAEFYGAECLIEGCDAILMETEVAKRINEYETLKRAMSEIYKPPKYGDGDKVDFDWRRNDYRFVCCNCDNVHILRFVVTGNKIRMRVFADTVLPEKIEICNCDHPKITHRAHPPMCLWCGNLEGK